jgi:hypothetical protein
MHSAESEVIEVRETFAGMNRNSEAIDDVA